MLSSLKLGDIFTHHIYFYNTGDEFGLAHLCTSEYSMGHIIWYEPTEIDWLIKNRDWWIF